MAVVLMMLATMALASRRLSGEEFGFWAICFAVLNFGTALDLGLRYGLGNRIAALTAQTGSEEEQRKTFWTVFHAESMIGLAGCIVCLVVLPWFDWAGLFKVQSRELAGQVRWLFPVICGLVVLNQPLLVASTVFFARQEIVFVSMLTVIQSGFLIVVFWLSLGSLSFPFIVLSFFGLYWLCGVGVTYILVRRYGWYWRAMPWREQWSVLRSFLRPSIDFFILCMASMTAGVIGPVVAGAAGGLVMAGDFSLIQRIFSFLATLHLALLAPLGPAYTFHARSGDWDWIRKQLRLCVWRVWPLMFVVMGALIWWGHPVILRLWTGRWISDYTLAGLFALGIVLTGWANTYSVLLNSLGVVRVQAVLSVMMLVPLVGLPVVLGKLMGIHGVALGSVVCVVPGAVLCVIWANAALKNRTVNV